VPGIPIIAETIAYSESDVATGTASQVTLPAARQKGNKTCPKSNRMPDAPHSVKVVAEVVDGI